MIRAARALLARGGVSAIAVATLALGFGVNAAIFSLTRNVLLTPLPFADADRLVLIGEVNRPRGISYAPPIPANYLSWRERVTAFESTAAWRFVYFTLSGTSDRPVRVEGVLAAPAFLPQLGIKPLLGRQFDRSDAQPGQDRVILLSHSFWRRQFSGDPHVVGRTIAVDGAPCVIVGVLPDSFKFFRVLNRELDVWRPLVADPTDREHTINLYGKLAAGISLDAARAQLAAAFLALPPEPFREGWTTDVAPLATRWTANQRPILLTLEAAVALVMCVAAVNVAGLVLAIAAGRRKDLAVRIALGATRWHLTADRLREALVLAGAGAVAGLLLASWIVDLLNRTVSYQDINRVEPFRVDAMVIAFTTGLALVTAVLFALLPSRRTLRDEIVADLKEAAPGATGSRTYRRTRGALVVAELALAIALLTSALELTRSAWSLTAMNRGVDSSRVMTAQVSLSGPPYEDASTMTRFAEAVIERLSAAAEVESASLVNYPPLSSIATSYPVEIENRWSAPGQEPRALCWIVGLHYFETVGIPIVGGRTFTRGDSSASPGVAIASRKFAARFWPAGDALGRQVTVLIPESAAFWIPRGKRRPLTIVGVADNVRIDGIGGPYADDAQLYLAYGQFPTRIATILVRPHGPPTAATTLIRNAVRAVDPDQPTFDEKTLDEVRQDTFARPREIAWLIGSFALLAVLLSGIGVYGVISSSVAQRTREIGIRIALGAGLSAVIRLVVHEMASVIAAGIGIGLPLSLALGRIIQSQMDGTDIHTPAALVSSAALLTVVALLASYLPARRAARLDPTLALRSE